MNTTIRKLGMLALTCLAFASGITLSSDVDASYQTCSQLRAQCLQAGGSRIECRNQYLQCLLEEEG